MKKVKLNVSDYRIVRICKSMGTFEQSTSIKSELYIMVDFHENTER